MNTSIIAKARIFMTTKDEISTNPHADICASCGLQRATERKTKALNSTFNQTEFFLFDSQFLCRECLDIFQNKNSRSKILFWNSPGNMKLLAREEVLPLLQSPPDAPFVLSVPYSFQKHHWFEAGLSQNGIVYVGTEQGCVELNYSKYDFITIISLVLHMLEVGVPRKELEIGTYSTFTLSRFGQLLEDWESQLRPFRLGGAIKLFVTYAPARKEKKLLNEEVKKVFSEIEQKGISILCNLAKASKYRQNDGLKFWQGYFKARIVRYMYEDINTFFSNVAKDTSADSILLDANMIAELDADTGNAVMAEIKNKTDLLIAATFSEIKEKQETIKETKNTATKKKPRSIQNANTLF